MKIININKVLRFARSFNTLIPVTGFVLILIFVAYGLISMALSPKAPKTTVSNTPISTQESDEQGVIFDLSEESIRGSDKLLLKLVAKKKDGRGYEGGYRYGTRNLLYIEEHTGESTWLFSNQQQSITSIDLLSIGKEHPLGLLLTTRKVEQAGEDIDKSPIQPTDVYFVSLDLKQKYIILKDIEHVFMSKQFGKDWAVIYKKSMEVHHAVYSLGERKIVSDKVVATLEEVK